MVRLLRMLLAMLLFGSTAGVAYAQSSQWTVSEVSGRVTLRGASGVEAVSRGTAVSPGAVIETGPGARAVVVRGKDFVTVAPGSRIRIPAAETREAGLFDVLQEWGNAIFQIEKKPDPHFSVGTPYLAAVVKGTTFSITVAEEGASLQVTEGAVETSTADGGARELIRPGIVAIVSSSDRYRLTVQGQDTKTIDSPQRPAGEAEAQPSSGNEQSATDLPEIAGGGEPGLADAAGSGVELAAQIAADASSPSVQLVLEPVASEPMNLAQVTGGLIGGSTANRMANVEIASARDAAREEPAGEGPGNGNGAGNGNGNGAGNGNGNGAGNGNGNGAGNGNGNGAGNGNGNGAGNGNGNGAGNGNGNGAGNGNGNGAGNGNGNGAGNGNGNGAGNGNGNGAGNGNGNGNGNGR